MAQDRQLWPRRVRRVVQAVAFLAFLAYVVAVPAMAIPPRRGAGVMMFSPLSGLGASVSAWSLIGAFWPALVLLVAALLLGRYFCGWLCPLGATLDLTDRLLARRTSPVPPEEGPEFEHRRARRAKYYLLTACLVAAFLGVSVFGLFDPLAIAVRSFVLVVHSYVAQAAAAALEALGLTGASAAVRTGLVAGVQPVFLMHVATLGLFGLLLGLELVRRRFWCRYLCPLGAMYALAGKVALTKRAVSEACIECGRCAAACPTGCISRDGHRTLNDECILCLDCQAVCPTRAVSFFGRAPAQQRDEVDLTRRGAVAAVGAGLLAYPLLRLKPSEQLSKGDPLIRPPLAGRDPEAFLSRCLRCGQCMRVCPTGVIQPAGLQAGLEGMWTPRLVPRLGYCIYECDACGRVCPSGAIPPFSLEEKHQTAIGLAYVDRTRCIPWLGNQRIGEEDFVADEHNCGVCEEVCPAPGKAIHFRCADAGLGQGRGGEGYGRARRAGEVSPEGGELRLPYVREEACVGCGFCEASCPVVGKPAIRVSGGFRQLPAPEERMAAPPETERALPARSGEFRLAGPKTTYAGPEELYEYINGGGEPYLTFNFIRVSTADYTDGERELKVGLWEFETTDDAYGAYAKDRRGEPVAVGDEGSMLEGSLWARHGRFMISVLDMDRTPPGNARRLAAEALEALEAEPAPRPQICRRLPRDGLRPQSVLFMRDQAPLYSVVLADEWIPEGTFGIEGGAVGAYGAYDLREDDRPAGLLLVLHPEPGPAAEAVGRLASVRRGWGEEQVGDQPYIVFRAGQDNYCAIGSRGPYFAAAFLMPTPEAGARLLADCLGSGR